MDEFNQDPYQFFRQIGPPTRFQPEWQGVGYKHFVFESSPVVHSIAPDGVHHQMIQVSPRAAHLPVERSLLNYLKETGCCPSPFVIPEHQSNWDYIGEQFGFPDSRPASMAQPVRELPADTLSFSEGDVNPATGSWSRLRDPMESTQPYRRSR